MSRERDEACLVCRFAVFSIPPPDWQPTDPGEKWPRSRYAAIIHMRKTERHVRAHCTFYPVGVDVWTHHWCGQFQRDTDDAWAGRYPAIREVIHGDHWMRHANRRERERDDLKKELKTVRAKSTARMKRIKLLEARIRVLDGTTKLLPAPTPEETTP